MLHKLNNGLTIRRSAYCREQDGQTYHCIVGQLLYNAGFSDAELHNLDIGYDEQSGYGISGCLPTKDRTTLVESLTRIQNAFDSLQDGADASASALYEQAEELIKNNPEEWARLLQDLKAEHFTECPA